MIIEPTETSAESARTLVVRLRNFVGDVVLGVPALRLLRSQGWRLHLVGRGWAPGLLAGEGWSVQVQAPARLDRIRQLRAFRGAPALVLPYSFSSALEARLAGLRATGYRYEGRGWLLARSVPMHEGMHELVRYWNLACTFLGIEAAPPARIGLATAPAHQREADERLAALGLNPDRFVLVCPFAGGTVDRFDKHWPHFAAYASRLLDRGVPVLACPGPGEADELRGWDPRLTIVPDLKLGPLGGLSRRAALVVSNDTGPGHLAAAVDADLISVLGPTPAAKWAPWGPQVGIVQRWPEWPDVAMVLDATAQRLARRGWALALA